MNTASPFGLIAQLAKTRIHLPLMHLETRFRIMGDIASVEMDQVFEQTARESLDVTYTFPLPATAAVHRCEMIINGRTIRAVVMEEGEARRTVAQKKAEGHRTALVEMDRDNLFTLQLGNTTPGDRIIIRFAYIEQLERLGTQLSLRVPFSPGVRYIPGKPLLRANRGLGSVDDTDQVPDASRITPPRISGNHPDAATLYLHGVLDDGEVDLRTLSSPTHPAILRSQSGHIEVELAGEEHLPDRDFVLRWDETTTAEPIAKSWSTTHDGHTYALLQIRAPQVAATSDDYTQDIYFLLDRSGSMEGLKWAKCAEALHAFVRVLGPRDRVWITCFESDYQDFSDDLMPRDELLADEGFLNLADIGTAGGTELLPALEHVLEICNSHDHDRSSRVIVITDGEVGNDEEIINLMKRPQHSHLPVHCFGIDDAVNDAFLKSLARTSGGRCALMTPNDDIPAAVQRLAETLRRPVLTQLTVQGAVITADDKTQLTDLHAAEVTAVAIQAAADTREAVLTERLPDGTAWTQRFVLNPENEDQAPRLQWAHQRSQHLVEQDRELEAMQLAIMHNLVCQGTSFVAWDELEKVPLATREVYQPSMLHEAEFCRSASASAAPTVCYSMAPPSAASMIRGSCAARLLTKGQRLLSTAKRSFDEPSPPAGALQDITLLFGTLGQIAPAKLETWTLPLRDHLITTGVEHDVASSITLLLHLWTQRVISKQRDKLLQQLLTELQASPSAITVLQCFIEANVTGDLLDHLRKLLAEVRTKSPVR